VRQRITAISTGSEVIRYYNGAGPNIGYMGAGVVEKVGAGVTRHQPGDRVRSSGPHHEFVVVSEESAQPIPAGVDDAQAAYAYLPTLGLHAMRLCHYQLGENVAFIGQGVVGLLSAAMATALGVNALAVDIDPQRLEIARQLGVKHRLNPDAATFQSELAAVVRDKGVDISVDVSGNYNGLVLAMEITRKWGHIAILGMYRPNPPNPEMAAKLHTAYSRNLHSKELRMVGCSNDPQEEYPSHIYRFTIHDNTRQSLALLGQQAYTITPAITHHLTPEEGLSIYPLLRQRDSGILGAVYHWD
jgi:threonine dehydrogenase-like Zn-dependent dehydrogenase